MAASAADRLSGKLEPYDEGPSSLVLALKRLGLTDCHEAAGSSAMGFTFCPKGRGVSRIDYVWANRPAIRWSSAERPARAAVATQVGPLSADHLPVVARISGCFQWGAGLGAASGPQRAVGVGPAERPRRSPMGVERQGRFRDLLTANEEYSTRGRAFVDEVREWPAVARAMTTLALPSTRVSEGAVRTARQAAIEAARGRGTGDRAWTQAIDEAAALLVGLIGGEAEINLQSRRREVMQAANEWFTKTARDHREAYDASRPPPPKSSAGMCERR